MKILSLGTYPIVDCMHGGQIRTKQFIDHYKKVLGKNNVLYIAVYNPHAYSVADKYDIPVSELTIKEISNNNYAEDVICGSAVWSDGLVKSQIINAISKFKPDIIECAQLYTFIGLKKILELEGVKVKLIYNSQNVEYKMKKGIYSSIGLRYNEKALKYLEVIKKNEKEISQKAVLTFAVSVADAEELKANGSKNTLVIPNSVVAKEPLPDKIAAWKETLIKDNAYKNVLFVGSAHIPNLTGFEELVADKPGFVDLYTKIYVVGSVCDLLDKKHSENSVIDVVFRNKVRLLGKLPEEDLRAIISVSDVLLLPITEGGGSNLKTAEAIYYANKIVATDIAMRSFDQFLNFPNIKIANDSAGFKNAILDFLADSKPNLTEIHKSKKKILTWEYALMDVSSSLFEGLK